MLHKVWKIFRLKIVCCFFGKYYIHIEISHNKFGQNCEAFVTSPFKMSKIDSIGVDCERYINVACTTIFVLEWKIATINYKALYVLIEYLFNSTWCSYNQYHSHHESKHLLLGIDCDGWTLL